MQIGYCVRQKRISSAVIQGYEAEHCVTQHGSMDYSSVNQTGVVKSDRCRWMSSNRATAICQCCAFLPFWYPNQVPFCCCWERTATDCLCYSKLGKDQHNMMRLLQAELPPTTQYRSYLQGIGQKLRQQDSVAEIVALNACTGT